MKPPSPSSGPKYIKTTMTPPAKSYLPPRTTMKPPSAGYSKPKTTMLPPISLYQPPKTTMKPPYQRYHSPKLITTAKAPTYQPPQSYHPPKYQPPSAGSLYAPPPPTPQTYEDRGSPGVPMTKFIRTNVTPKYPSYQYSPPASIPETPAETPASLYQAPRQAYLPPKRLQTPHPNRGPKSPNPITTTYAPPAVVPKKSYTTLRPPKETYRSPQPTYTTMSPPREAYHSPGPSTTMAPPHNEYKIPGPTYTTIKPPSGAYISPVPSYVTVSPPSKDYRAPAIITTTRPPPPPTPKTYGYKGYKSTTRVPLEPAYTTIVPPKKAYRHPTPVPVTDYRLASNGHPVSPPLGVGGIKDNFFPPGYSTTIRTPSAQGLNRLLTDSFKNSQRPALRQPSLSPESEGGIGGGEGEDGSDISVDDDVVGDDFR